MSEIQIAGLEKSFGPLRVLRQLDLLVPDRALAAVLGPSGCGKTTLLRLIAGFEAADGGTIAIGGEIVEGGRRHVPPEDRRVGYVPQEGALFPHLSVGQNVGFGLARGDPNRDRTIAETLELVGLGGLEHRRPNQLSGGQQQRVAVARALAPRPRVILLDEPFAALDPATRAAMRAEVAELLRSIGTTTILVTHDQAEALSVTDLVAVMHGGRVAQVDSPQRLYAHPASRDVATFVGEANLVPARIEGEVAHTALGALPLLPGRRSTGIGDADAHATILVRPEQILIGPPGGLTARVTGTTFFGHDALVTLELVTGTPPTVLEARTSDPVPELGELVGVSIFGGVVPIPVQEVEEDPVVATNATRARWWRRKPPA